MPWALTSDIAPILRQYLNESKAIGDNTSLVMFSRPGPALGVPSYESKFWGLLTELANQSNGPWPDDIPINLNDPAWEFCFEGQPIFVVCNTPSHILRQSRRSTSFMLTFQPRWVFDKILGTPEMAKRSQSKVRARLKPYDIIEPSPHLGLYGQKDNFEYKQYFLRDDNNEVECPFHSLVYNNKKKTA